MVSKAELNLIIRWSYTPNMKITQSDVIDDIWDRVYRHVLGNEVYTCGERDSLRSPYREYQLSITDDFATLSVGEKNILLMDYAEEPSWKPKKHEEESVQTSFQCKNTEEMKKRLLDFVKKSRQRRLQPVFTSHMKKPMVIRINDVEIKSPSYEEKTQQKEYLLCVKNKKEECMTKASFTEEEDDAYVPFLMLLWIKQHSKVKTEGTLSIPYENALANKLYEETKRDFRLSQEKGQLQKTIWARFGLSLEKFFCIENKSCILLDSILLKESFQEKGVGSNVLKEIVSYADKKGKILVLAINDKYGVSHLHLKRFFRTFGFEYVGLSNENPQMLMMRIPQIKETSKQRSISIDGCT